jgi:hypothetical protein
MSRFSSIFVADVDTGVTGADLGFDVNTGIGMVDNDVAVDDTGIVFTAVVVLTVVAEAPDLYGAVLRVQIRSDQICLQSVSPKFTNSWTRYPTK